MLPLIRCPACGHRAPGAALSSVARPLGHAAASGIVAVVVPALVMVWPSWWLWSIPLIMAVVLVGSAWRERRRWRDADRAMVREVRAGVVAPPDEQADRVELPVAVALTPFEPRRPAQLEPLAGEPPAPVDSAPVTGGPRILKR